MHEALSSFPVVIEVPVAWGEMDSLQHVNNTVYFRWLESGRMAYFERVDYVQRMLKSGLGPILASTRCAFKFPLTYPDTVWVGTGTTAMGEDRFTMRQIIFSQRHERVAAEGESVLVSYDYRTGRKVPMPDDVRQRIADLQVGGAPAGEP